jgi:hypothetical protein
MYKKTAASEGRIKKENETRRDKSSTKNVTNYFWDEEIIQKKNTDEKKVIA